MGDMKYIILSYEKGNGQIMLQALGPETILGMVADVLRGNYAAPNDNPVNKIEIGTEIDREKWKVA